MLLDMRVVMIMEKRAAVATATVITNFWMSSCHWIFTVISQLAFQINLKMSVPGLEC